MKSCEGEHFVWLINEHFRSEEREEDGAMSSASLAIKTERTNGIM